MEDFHILKDRMKHVEDERAMVTELLGRYEEQLVPNQHKFRSQMIQNDINKVNTLVVDSKVTGIINFGDICHSHLTN